jgi:7,8-dihydroneopterin aldolase/epimerase/oxygenase
MRNGIYQKKDFDRFTIHQMSSTFIIQLKDLRFFGAHGLYAEERRAGNEFEVNLSLAVKAPKAKIVSLEETINYAEVYRLLNERFAIRTNLLETLAMEIAEELKQQFPAIRKISVQITKLDPPIAAFTGSVSVTYNKSYKE